MTVTFMIVRILFNFNKKFIFYILFSTVRFIFGYALDLDIVDYVLLLIGEPQISVPVSCFSCRSVFLLGILSLIAATVDLALEFLVWIGAPATFPRSVLVFHVRSGVLQSCSTGWLVLLLIRISFSPLIF
jgi:hypothetical protein